MSRVAAKTPRVAAHHVPVLDRDAAPPVPFQQAAAVILGDLQHALSDLLDAAPGHPIRKAADVERAFGVDYKLAWQIFRIVRAENPLAAGTHVPAKVSIKKFLTAAARRRIPAGILARVTGAFGAFEQLAAAEAGDRGELEAMLSAFLPEERGKQELASRQSAFKGMSQIKGLVMEADVATTIYHPSRDGVSIDSVTVNCDFGLRRVRPDARIMIGSGGVTTAASAMTTLAGEPIHGPLGALLPEFSTSPPPRLEVTESEGFVYYMAGAEVGMRSAVDLVLADRLNRSLPRYAQPGMPPVRGLAHYTDTPAKRMTVDVFLHSHVYPGVPPQYAVYDIVGRGIVRLFDDPAREHDRLNLHDTIRPLPIGLAGARLPHVPRYVDILRHVYDAVGWDPAEFRGYRLDVQYPVYGAQYIIGFRLPEKPA
jgi:hypothetical protein